MDRSKRNRLTPNEIREYGPYVGVVLYNSKQQEVAECLVSKEDKDRVKKNKWYLTKNGYVASDTRDKRSLYLHRFILSGVEEVDHINRNRLDCRRENLRPCTRSENIRNGSKRNTNTSGIVGVSWDKGKNKWVARIVCNYKQIVLGRFEYIEDATLARRQAERVYFGEFAPR